MCLAPVIIKNPNYQTDRLKSLYPSLAKSIAEFKDVEHSHLLVPCGKCKECTFSKQNNYLQKAYFESRHSLLYMVTLTYSNDAIPSFVSSNPEIGRVCYPLQKDVADMFKRIRRHNLFGVPFKYFGVSEYGSSRMRPHFHLLLAIPKPYTNELDNVRYGKSMESVISRVFRSQWKRNIALNAMGKTNTRKPIWQACSLFYGRYIRGKWNTTFDCHLVVEDNEYMSKDNKYNGVKRYSSDNVSFYVTKYILKEDERITRLLTKLSYTDKENYKKYASKIKPSIFMSHDFGSLQSSDFPLIRKYVQLGLDDPDCLNPMFIGCDGKLYNCGRFLKSQMIKNHLMTIEEQTIFDKRRLAFVLGLSAKIELSDDELIAEYNRRQRLLVKRPGLMSQLREKHDISSTFLEMDVPVNSFVDYYVKDSEKPVYVDLPMNFNDFQ